TNRLVRFRANDPDWVIENEFAEEIEQVDPVTVKFRIKKGVPWSGGFGETTMEDVKYSFERIAGITGLTADYVVDWGALKEVEIIDAYTGVIHLKEPFAPLWASSLPYGSGNIICKAAVEALPDKRFTTENPAYNGPYRIREWLPKQKLVFEPNPDWPFEKAPWDEIVVIPIEDGKAAEIAYLAGEVALARIEASSIKTLAADMPKDSTVLRFPPNAYAWLGVNAEQQLADGSPGPLQDINLRRAIQLGVDVPQVLEAGWFGEAQPATGIVAPGLVGHREANLYSFDPDKARQLVKDGGYEGLKLQMALQNVTWATSAGQVIAANLADIGLEVELTPLDSGTFWTLGFADSPTVMTNQLILNRFTMAPDPSWATEWFTNHQIGIWNWERFRSDEFEQLNTDGVKETDRDKRQAIYARMQDLMEESGSYLFLTHGVNAFIYNHAILKPALGPDGQNQSLREHAPA
ncbi:MAG: peptide ABC transporter substrate-binding protein, partial [Alphaproteobacteria bacterium]|nr:peptide ABC transporter substrate-binding protein [Alphaproteobacteria bacterium]